ncbi:glutathione S-transferase family protein [uncultured Hoeflea sp.]|uniref:glutathione S-transferase family protein n=1 Tax=uncultured Hoeflea sp. TaxID=538666 RepID=UPI0030DAD144|tara:strand:+ start:169 stop:783 length:615 start_codon:yes stop_codon:yes gene_type:complete
MLTFFHSPGSCSNGILLLLNEIDADFDTRIVDIGLGDQRADAYLAQNPKGKVPALKTDDQTVLTEFQTIAYWLANAYPDAGLWPYDVLAQSRTLEALDFIVGSVHMRGFTFVKVPQKFLADDAGKAALQAHGRTEVGKGLLILSEMMGERDYLLGDFGLADAALFYVLDWAKQEGFMLPENLSACHLRLQQRPSFRKSLPLWTR